MGTRNNWWRTGGGISLCGFGGMGEPMHIHLLGDSTFAQAGPVLVMAGLAIVAMIWMFRRFGGDTSTTPSVVSESDELWAELERLEAIAETDEDAGEIRDVPAELPTRTS